MERDPIRCFDSIHTFEEILLHAAEQDVDLILLGGDLFHDNKPSRHTLYRTMELLRQHCMGSKPIRFEILSDPKTDFWTNRFGINYEARHQNHRPFFSLCTPA